MDNDNAYFMGLGVSQNEVSLNASISKELLSPVGKDSSDLVRQVQPSLSRAIRVASISTINAANS